MKQELPSRHPVITFSIYLAPKDVVLEFKHHVTSCIAKLVGMKCMPVECSICRLQALASQVTGDRKKAERNTWYSKINLTLSVPDANNTLLEGCGVSRIKLVVQLADRTDEGLCRS